MNFQGWHDRDDNEVPITGRKVITLTYDDNGHYIQDNAMWTGERFISNRKTAVVRWRYYDEDMNMHKLSLDEGICFLNSLSRQEYGVVDQTYKQLADWLIELKMLRRALGRQPINIDKVNEIIGIGDKNE